MSQPGESGRLEHKFCCYCKWRVVGKQREKDKEQRTSGKLAVMKSDIAIKYLLLSKEQSPAFLITQRPSLNELVREFKGTGANDRHPALRYFKPYQFQLSSIKRPSYFFAFKTAWIHGLPFTCGLSSPQILDTWLAVHDAWWDSAFSNMAALHRENQLSAQIRTRCLPQTFSAGIRFWWTNGQNWRAQVCSKTEMRASTLRGISKSFLNWILQF